MRLCCVCVCAFLLSFRLSVCLCVCESRNPWNTVCVLYCLIYVLVKSVQWFVVLCTFSILIVKCVPYIWKNYKKMKGYLLLSPLGHLGNFLDGLLMWEFLNCATQRGTLMLSGINIRMIVLSKARGYLCSFKWRPKKWSCNRELKEKLWKYRNDYWRNCAVCEKNRNMLAIFRF